MKHLQVMHKAKCHKNKTTEPSPFQIIYFEIKDACFSQQKYVKSCRLEIMLKPGTS